MLTDALTRPNDSSVTEGSPTGMERPGDPSDRVTIALAPPLRSSTSARSAYRMDPLSEWLGERATSAADVKVTGRHRCGLCLSLAGCPIREGSEGPIASTGMGPSSVRSRVLPMSHTQAGCQGTRTGSAYGAGAPSGLHPLAHPDGPSGASQRAPAGPKRREAILPTCRALHPGGAQRRRGAIVAHGGRIDGLRQRDYRGEGPDPRVTPRGSSGWGEAQ